MNWYGLCKVATSLQIDIETDVSDIPYRREGDDIRYLDDAMAKELVRQAVTSYYGRWDTSAVNNMAVRYRFLVTEANDRYDFATFDVRIIPKQEDRGQPEIVGPDHPSYEFYKEFHGGLTGNVVYKTPKDAIEAIPASDSLAYRGMSWEEWQNIRETGFIMSKGTMNLGEEQQGITLFGQEPGVAEHYSAGFAPIQYKPSMKRPGVVIAVPRKLLLTNKDRPEAIPESELGAEGPLDSKNIVGVWFVIVTKTSQRTSMEFKIPWVRESKDAWVWILDASKARTGSGNTGVISGYSIIKKM